MDLLIGWQKIEKEIQGTAVSYEIRSLKRDAFLALIPYITESQDLANEIEGLTDAVKIGKIASATLKLQQLVEPFIEDHVRNITGITLDGQPIEPVQLAQEALLSNVCATVIGDLFTISTVTGGEEKNLKKQSDSSPSGEPPVAKSTE